tara:strand:+ start:8871 stop:10025 length:1155 start_codon:yes stop_codon:yes gene_type:complete
MNFRNNNPKNNSSSRSSRKRNSSTKPKDSVTKYQSKEGVRTSNRNSYKKPYLEKKHSKFSDRTNTRDSYKIKNENNYRNLNNKDSLYSTDQRINRNKPYQKNEKDLIPLEFKSSNSPDINKDFIWGKHTVLSFLESDQPIHRIWCTSELRSSNKFFQILKDTKSSGALLEEVSWSRLGQLTHGAVHQGIVLQKASSATIDLKNMIKKFNELDENPIVVAMDGLTDPQNVGAIIRSSEALGVHGIVIPQRRNAGLTGTVAKVAAGALEHIPIARVINLNRSLEEFKKNGYQIIGLSSEGEKQISQIQIDTPVVLVVGSEGKGLSLLTKRTCDQLIRIPLRGVTPSLNASVSVAISIYEISKSSWMKGLSNYAASPKIIRPDFSIH